MKPTNLASIFRHLFRFVLFLAIAIVFLSAWIERDHNRGEVRRAVSGSQSHGHHIKQFSEGAMVGEWDSVAAVWRDASAANWCFLDTMTRLPVCISGAVQITLAEERQ